MLNFIHPLKKILNIISHLFYQRKNFSQMPYNGWKEWACEAKFLVTVSQRAETPLYIIFLTSKEVRALRRSYSDIISLTILKRGLHTKYKQIKHNLSENGLNNQQLTCPTYCWGGTPGATLCCPFTTAITNSNTETPKTFIFGVTTAPVNKNSIIKHNGSWGSSVSIVSDYILANWGSIPSRDKGFFV
jgi:hypothetical protein